jgi:hypothetical protein
VTRDKRYEALKVLIESGHITEFRQMFHYIPPSVVYKDLGINYFRFKKLINDTRLFTIKELIFFASFCNLDPKRIFELAYGQYELDHSRKTNHR